MKKILLGLLAVLVVGGLTGGGIVFLQKRETKSPLPEKQETETKKLPSTSLKEYADPSGFTLSYPDDLSVLANEAEDNTVYADVDFTSKDAKGVVNIHITDSKLKSLADWLAAEDFEEKASIKDVSLGEMKAKEVREQDSITLAALDQGVLFTINASFQNEKDFWQSAYDKIVSSFSFAQPESGSASSGSSGSSGSSSDVIFEGEEVVE